jgi:hypothetical protein
MKYNKNQRKLMPKIQQFKIKTGFCRFSFRTETKTLETKQELTSKNDRRGKISCGHWVVQRTEERAHGLRTPSEKSASALSLRAGKESPPQHKKRLSSAARLVRRTKSSGNPTWARGPKQYGRETKTLGTDEENQSGSSQHERETGDAQAGNSPRDPVRAGYSKNDTGNECRSTRRREKSPDLTGGQITRW